MSTSAASVHTTSVSKPMSLADFSANYSGDYVELIAGHVTELPMPSPKHGKICARSSRFLDEYAEKHDSGHVMCNDSFVRIKTNPETVRGADVSYYTYERLPKGKVPEGVLPIVPDAIFEVRSKSDRWNAVFAKVVEYLNAGVRVVVLLDEPSCSASVYRADEIQQVFHNGDELVVPDVLPGFAVPVRRFFE